MSLLNWWWSLMKIFELIVVIILIIISILWLIYVKDLIEMFKIGEFDMEDNPYDYLHVIFCRIVGAFILIYFIKLFIDILCGFAK